MLDGEHFASTREARLHLVGNEENSILVENLLDFPEVVRRRHNDSALAHDRLGNECRYIVGSGKTHYIINRLGTMTPAFFRIAAPLRAIGVRRRRKGDSRSVRSSALLAPHVARDAERPPAAAVEAGVQRNVFVLSRVEARQLESAFNRLRAAVAEKSFGQAPGSDVSDFFRQISNRLRMINV